MRRFMMGIAIAAASWIPAGAFAGDQEMAQSVASNLKTSGRLKGYSIDVKAKDATVILMGKVATDEQLAAAVDVANNTPGVEKVIVQLSVAQSKASSGGLRQPGSPTVDTDLPKLAQSSEQSMRRRQTATNASYETAPTEAPVAATVKTTPSAPPQSLPSHEAASIHNVPAAAMQPQRSIASNGPAMNPNYPQMPNGPMASQQMPSPQMMGQQGPQQRPVPYVAMNNRQQGQPAAMSGGQPGGEPIPAYAPGMGGGAPQAHYDHPQMPNYAWPSYASYPNYAAVTYPKQYSATAWPFIGPFYPYPQVPLGWRKVTLEWDDGWWFLDFDDRGHHCRH